LVHYPLGITASLRLRSLELGKPIVERSKLSRAAQRHVVCFPARKAVEHPLGKDNLLETTNHDTILASTPRTSASTRIDRRAFIREVGSLFLRSAAAATITSSACGCGGGSQPNPLPQTGQPDEGVPPEGYIRLAFNESPYGPPPAALAAVDEMLSRPYAMASQETHFLPGINRYPDFLNTDLTDAIAGLHGVSALNVIPCCGISELLYMCSEAFLGRGRNLIITDGTFPLVRHYAASRGADIILIPPAQDYHVDLDAIVDAVRSDTSLVYLANPDNPTGTIYSFAEIKSFVEAVVNKNSQVAVLLDEAYMDYVLLDPLPEAVPLVEQYPVIVGRTFSKAYGMAGLRGGYAVAHRDLVHVLNGDSGGFFGGDVGWRMFECDVNRLATAAIIGSLSPSGQDFVAQVRQQNAEIRQLLSAGLRSLGYTPLESHTNFLLVNVGIDGERMRNWLCNRNILIQAAGSFHPRYGNWIRVSVGDQSEIDALLATLAGFDPSSQPPPCFAVFYMGI
jgi:histidinol-phosphate aminotransferase